MKPAALIQVLASFMAPSQDSQRLAVVHGGPGQGKVQLVYAAVKHARDEHTGWMPAGAYIADLSGVSDKDALVNR